MTIVIYMLEDMVLMMGIDFIYINNLLMLIIMIKMSLFTKSQSSITKKITTKKLLLKKNIKSKSLEKIRRVKMKN